MADAGHPASRAEMAQSCQRGPMQAGLLSVYEADAKAFGREARLSVEHLDAQGLRALDAAEWDALSAGALVENPFYAREVVLAGLDTIDSGVHLEALVVWGERRELLGLFPYERRHLPFETADAA